MRQKLQGLTAVACLVVASSFSTAVGAGGGALRYERAVEPVPLYVVNALKPGYASIGDAQLSRDVDHALAYWAAQGDTLAMTMTALTRTTDILTNQCEGTIDFDDLYPKAEAEFPGIDFGLGSRATLLVVVPADCDIGSLGYGGIGHAIARGDERLANTTIHELGHVFGLNHAYALKCYGDDCRETEYAGDFGPMGSGYGMRQPSSLNSVERDFLGLFQDGEVSDVDLGASPALTSDFTLMPRDSDHGLRTLRVLDPDTLRATYIEYRSGAFADADAFYAPGHAQGYSPGLVMMQQMWPQTSASLAYTHDANGNIWSQTFSAGETVQTESGSVRATVLQLSPASGATIRLVVEPTMPLLPDIPELKIAARIEPSAINYLSFDGTWPRDTTHEIAMVVDGTTIAAEWSWTDPYEPIPSPLIEDGMAGSAVSFIITSRPPGHRAVRQSTPDLVVRLPMVSTAAPKVVGKAKVGKTLSVRPGEWTPGTRFSYQWYASGAAIPGATSKRVVLRKRLKGQAIHVRVTGRLAGYESAWRDSATVTVRS